VGSRSLNEGLEPLYEVQALRREFHGEGLQIKRAGGCQPFARPVVGLAELMTEQPLTQSVDPDPRLRWPHSLPHTADHRNSIQPFKVNPINKPDRLRVTDVFPVPLVVRVDFRGAFKLEYSASGLFQLLPIAVRCQVSDCTP
jgi:hypothetical protein